MLTKILDISDKVKIPGESTVNGFEEGIDLKLQKIDFEMPMINDKSSNNRTSGRAKISNMVVYMRLNKAVPKLAEACVKGSNLGNVKLALVKVSEGKIERVLDYSMTDTYVAGVEVLTEAEIAQMTNGDSLNADADLPWVKAELNFQKISLSYNWFDAAGANKGAVAAQDLTGLGG